MLKVLGVAVLLIAMTGFVLGAAAVTKDNLANMKNDEILNTKGMNDESDPRPPILLNHGGPDGGGYYFIDSDDDAANRPVYSWIDISVIGTEVTTWTGTVDDGYTSLIPMEMNFTFYGNLYTDIVISTNGWVSFLSQTNSYFSNSTIPTAANPNAIVAVEWDDLDGGTVGHCYYYYDSVNNQFIVAWVNWPYYPDPTAPHDLEVILKDNGDIITQYGNITGTWHTSSTVGIENESGTIGTQVAYNQEYLRSGLAILYGLTPPIYANHDVTPNAFVSPAAFGRLNTPLIPVVTFMNLGTASESFPGRLIINHIGQVYNQTQQISNLAPAGSVDITFPSFTPTQEGIYELVAISELSTDSIPGNDTLRMNYNVYANVYSQDFEADNGQFTGDNDWQWGNPTNPGGPGGAHSGSNVWAVGLTGPYTVGPLLSALISPPINLGDNPVLTYWQWYLTENTFDGGNVKISTDAGATWTLITPEEGYTGVLSTTFENPIGGEEAFFGSSNGWVQATFDLSTYGGSTVQFKFDFGSDRSVVSVGWFVDDFTVLSSGEVGIGDRSSDLPREFSLSQNYPNPFNPTTTIGYGLPQASQVNIEIYDLLGRKIVTVDNGVQTAGFHQFVWDASDATSGIYFFKITAGAQTQTRKMLLLK